MGSDADMAPYRNGLVEVDMPNVSSEGPLDSDAFMHFAQVVQQLVQDDARRRLIAAEGRRAFLSQRMATNILAGLSTGAQTTR
jgi:hypothetical protein